MERDVKMLETAKANGDVYVWVDLRTGLIKGRSRVFHDNGEVPENRRMFEMMTVAEYEWLTDKSRVTNVVTAADMYDSVKWTNGGFVVGNGFIPVSKRSD